MSIRKNISTRARVALFNAASGICCLCNGKIDAGQAWIAEHVIPLALGGEDGGDNIKPAHQKCANAKTHGADGDIATIAKSKRKEAKHIGAKIKSKGFSPVEKQHRASRPVEKIARLPKRRLYEEMQ